MWPRRNFLSGIIGGCPGASADDAIHDKKISWMCPYPGCGWAISKKHFETGIRFNQRIIKHYVRHFSEKKEKEDTMLPSFITAHRHVGNTECDICKKIIVPGDEYKVLITYKLADLIWTTYCLDCWGEREMEK